MAKFHSNKSFLRSAGTLGNFLDVNSLPKIRKSAYDEKFKITADVDGRPDLLAYKLYGTTELWWVFALRNPDVLIDPIRDFRAGVTIILPSGESVKQATGGN